MALKNNNPDHVLTAEELRKGGKNSAEARKEKKKLKECLLLLLDEEIATDKNGNKVTATEAMASKAVKEAIKGDWKAWELVRDTTGQKPVDKVENYNADMTINLVGFDEQESEE